ncbi:MAG: (2Fe-2S)-binding protein [Gammaproteobacteria bacterium]|jgi:isoquinoline 1-oxidoreductase alpha subunit|nr:(2Fe-2S)-binding protein [Gammaproteobacteria bacterium]
MTIQINLNGETAAIDADGTTPLLWVLRDRVGLTGTKFGCGKGLCGACTIHLDGNPVRSCQTTLEMAEGREVTTIETLGGDHPELIAAWRDHNVPQCGYCQSGQLMSAAALLESNSNPSDADIDSALSGNICRCGTYPRIKAAIKDAARARS